MHFRTISSIVVYQHLKSTLPPHEVCSKTKILKPGSLLVNVPTKPFKSDVGIEIYAVELGNKHYHFDIETLLKNGNFSSMGVDYSSETICTLNFAVRSLAKFSNIRLFAGARFAVIVVKAGLISIIKKFRVTLNERTQTPITYDTNAFVTTVRGGVWLNVSSIS